MRSFPVSSWPDVLGELEDLVIGERVKLACTERLWHVKAKGDQFVILTQPFNSTGRTLYTVLDLRQGLRGTLNTLDHHCHTPEGIAASLLALEAGTIGLLESNQVPIDAEWVIPS